MAKTKKSNRKIEAEKIFLELVELEYLRRSDKVAGKLLTGSCIQCEQRTKEVPSQKQAYKGVKFKFESPLDMAIYFITELEIEWEAWKQQSKTWQQTKGKIAKGNARPSIDRIDTYEIKHYQKGNLRMKSLDVNRCQALEKLKKPVAMLTFENGSFSVTQFESKRDASSFINVSDAKLNNMMKKSYDVQLKDDDSNVTNTSKQVLMMPVRTLKPKNEEERQAMFKEYGLTYEPPEIRAINDAKAIARIKKQLEAEKDAP